MILISMISAKVQSVQTKSWVLVSLLSPINLAAAKSFTLSFSSIPGFQVYDVSTGRIKRYGREYGKKLNESTVIDGIIEFSIEQ